MLPRTPELTRAYGLRVFEISQSSRHNPKGNRRDGPFSAHVGADGTAIWAAATSGANAIPILMLACMLARIWSATEATSLWVELVEHRRHEIATECSNDESALFAAQQDISRSQLSDWDASARAWLWTADGAKSVQQTQLMLVVNNLQLPVSNNINVYQSVIESSRIALLSMEKLLTGQPQRAQNGAFLLGLSSWHLYPEMVVHGAVTQKIDQKDDLFPPGSVVALGLEGLKGVDKGVYWSFPLAHLRYYGDPVQSSRSTGHDASRISIDHLIYVSLGSLFVTCVETSQETKSFLPWLSLLWDCFKRTNVAVDGCGGTRKGIRAKEVVHGSGWLKMLMVAANEFSSLRSHERELASKLMALGHRRFHSFLAERDHCVPPYFGLQRPSALLPLLKNDDERIKALRGIAQHYGLADSKVIIRYRRITPQDKKNTQEKVDDTVTGESHIWLSAYEYATAFPIAVGIDRTNRSGSGEEMPCHYRWVAIRWNEDNEHDSANIAVRSPRKQNSKHPAKLADSIDLDNLWRWDPREKIQNNHGLKSNSLLRALQKTRFAACRCPDGCKLDCLCTNFDYGCIAECFCNATDSLCFVNRTPSRQRYTLNQRITVIRSLGEACIEEHPRSFVDYYRKPKPMKRLEEAAYGHMRDDYKRMWEAEGIHHAWRLSGVPWEAEYVPSGTEPPRLRLIYGDPKTAALYSIQQKSPPDQIRSQITHEELRAIFENDVVDLDLLSDYLLNLEHGQHEPCISSLKALASTKKIYKHLPGATVALNVASKSLCKSLWATKSVSNNLRSLGIRSSQAEESKPLIAVHWNPWLCEMSLASSFARIAMFESGSYNLDPRSLDHVFAMSSGNSLFVAAPLLDDPSHESDEIHIKRVVGNIGRAGMAMLIAPQDPRIRKPQMENWELVNHAPSNGQATDSFQNTTHHLSFTQYTMPCNVGKHGAQDIEAFFIESLVSVYDSGKWVADLDVLGMLRNRRLSRFNGHFKGCDHLLGSLPVDELIAIDNWEELLDREQRPVVVRAFDNPVGRLATAAVSVKQGYYTILVKERVCWHCALRVLPCEKAITFIQ